ncbi:344_t:CDS:1 [Paraglomus brasilianum]|uniref:344_t:CDS:1 n=1 Tax=Paraglomus brasilianum TaxID=144538 RepID=A0A9N9AZX0_9GLOM|nr:344_t:CDS:1 [Paraglomus brasilianum]
MSFRNVYRKLKSCQLEITCSEFLVNREYTTPSNKKDLFSNADRGFFTDNKGDSSKNTEEIRAQEKDKDKDNLPVTALPTALRVQVKAHRPSHPIAKEKIPKGFENFFK